MPSAQEIKEAIKDDVMEEDTGKDDAGVRVLNAFDVVSMFGGLALNNMLRSAHHKHVHRPCQFISDKTPDAIVGAIGTALSTMKCKPEVDKAAFTVKAHKLTPKGEISMEVRMANLSDAFHIVEVVRGRGDLLEYSKM